MPHTALQLAAIFQVIAASISGIGAFTAKSQVSLLISHTPNRQSHITNSVSSSTILFASGDSNNGKSDVGSNTSNKRNRNKKYKKKSFTTLGDLTRQLKNQNRDDMRSTQKMKKGKKPRRKGGGQSSVGDGAGGRRTRKSVRGRGMVPQQTYVYASQRKKHEQENQLEGENMNSIDEDVSAAVTTSENSNIQLAKEFGMQLQSQSSLPLALSNAVPKIVGEIRVRAPSPSAASESSNDASPGDCAYVINKPAGWGILGGGGTTRNNNRKKKQAIKSSESTSSSSVSNDEQQIQDEMDLGMDLSVLASVMTPEELAELQIELGSGNGGGGEKAMTKSNSAPISKPTGEMADMDMYQEDNSEVDSNNDDDFYDSRPDTLRINGNPSLVNWFKNHIMETRGIPIRGGKYWKAITGAMDVDDSGLVILCPKGCTESVFVDYVTYVAVVGNGGPDSRAPRGKMARERKSTYDRTDITFDVVSRLRTGRENDSTLTAAITLSDGLSSCSDVVRECQDHYDDGIRGDPSGDPLDRRAPRRLIHCGALSVSSLVEDDDVEAMEDPPDDIAILSERGEWGQDFVGGSRVGRTDLMADPLTTAYREINGAADGFPGWIVDRYGKWLLVQQRQDDAGFAATGPLPPVTDEHTSGIYMFKSATDRSTISNVKPELVMGKEAPNPLIIKENGINYLVNMGESFSTGIFLDQRLQRAWLARNCDTNTRLLNCFAHCGAFSVAAAVAGASTVSLDLDKKWLDRIKPQMEANDINYEGKHDCIYGDCFDWLSRLSKRGEKFDIVILDPPSTSVGGKKKKRWSAKNDMDEIVALAAPLVKSGGLLWTTTNSASIPVSKFVRQCKKGFEMAGLDDVKLERIAPMPVDFPSIGSSPVKNLVWRLR